MKNLPAKFKAIIRKTKRVLPVNFPDTLGIILIGSCAEGCFSKDSDIDIVWLKSRKLRFEKLRQIQRGFSEKTTIIPYNKKQILYQFQNSTTMSHSIKNGKILYKNGGFVNKLMGHKLSAPSPEWMKYWFGHWVGFYEIGVKDYRRNKIYHKKHCTKKCFCDTVDALARAAVNFAILFLELKGFIPTTKHKILNGFIKLGDPGLIRGLRISLRASREGRNLSLKEAEAAHKTAKSLKEKIQKELNSKLYKEA